jgi:hypothetical protein
MTTHEHSRDDGGSIGARTEAATLFARAVNHESADSATRLNCIAARLALQVSMVPSPQPVNRCRRTR